VWELPTGRLSAGVVIAGVEEWNMTVLLRLYGVVSALNDRMWGRVWGALVQVEVQVLQQVESGESAVRSPI
jgi:hypothetical protein